MFFALFKLLITVRESPTHLNVEIGTAKNHAVEPSELVLGMDCHDHPANSSDVHVKLHLHV